MLSDNGCVLITVVIIHSIAGMLLRMQQYTLDGALVHLKAPCTQRISHLAPIIVTSSSNCMFLDCWREMENPKDTLIDMLEHLLAPGSLVQS